MNNWQGKIERRVSAFSIGVCLWIVAYGLWLRWPHLFGSFWLDELHTAWIVNGDWSEVVTRCQIGNQSPLYFWMLKLSQWGDAQEWTLRLGSLLAGMALVASLIVVVQRATHSWFLTIAAVWLAALDRRLIFYATEARPYAWVQLLALWHVVLTFRLGKEGPDHAHWPVRLAWVAIAALLSHLHYTAALFVVAEAIWLAADLLWRRVDWAVWRARFVDAGLLLLFAAPAIPHVLQVASRRQMWSGMGAPDRFVDAVRVLDAHWYLGAAALFTVFAYLAAGRGRARGSIAVDDRRRLALWLAAALIPPALAWASAYWQLAPLFHSRYLISSAAATIVAAVCIIGFLGPTSRAVGAATLILTLLFATPQPARYLFYGKAISDRREDWRGANEWAFDEAKRLACPVMIRSGLLESPIYFDRIDDPAISDYLCFPIRAYYPAGRHPPYGSYPLVDHREAPIRDTAFVDVRESREVVLLIRGRKEDATRLVQRVRHQLSANGPIAVKWGPDFGLVHAVVIEIRRPQRF